MSTHSLDTYVKLNLSSKAWFYGEGLKLPVDLQYDTTLAKQAFEVSLMRYISCYCHLTPPPQLAARWEASRDTPIKDLTFEDSDLKEFNTNQIGGSPPSSLLTSLLIVTIIQSSSLRNCQKSPLSLQLTSTTCLTYTALRLQTTQKSDCAGTNWLSPALLLWTLHQWQPIGSSTHSKGA